MTDAWPEVDPDEIPGSRPRVVHATPEELPERDKPWDAVTRVWRINGVDVETVKVSALARALNRPVEAIKYWERKEWFPESDIRTPRQHQGRALRSNKTGAGGTVQGHRLYPRAFVAALVEVAKELDLLDQPGKTIEGTDFSRRAFDLWEEHYPR